MTTHNLADDWNRSDDWVIVRSYLNRCQIAIRFGGKKPSVKELLALRRCCEEFRHVRPSELIQMLDGNEMKLGQFENREARAIEERARAEGLDVVVVDISCTHDLPMNRTTNQAWLLEDEAEKETIVQSMLAAGVRVEHVEY